MNDSSVFILMITSRGVGFIPTPLGLNLIMVTELTSNLTMKIAERSVPFVFFMLIMGASSSTYFSVIDYLLYGIN